MPGPRVETVLSHNSPLCLHWARVARVLVSYTWVAGLMLCTALHQPSPAQPSPGRAAAHIIQPGTDKVTINCYPAAVRGAASAHSLSSPSSWSRDTAGHRQPAGAAAEQLVINILLLKKPRHEQLTYWIKQTTFNGLLAQLVIK